MSKSTSATEITYERTDSKRVCVRKAGAFIGWLEQSSRRSSGLPGQRYTFWSGLIAGRDVNAVTLTKAKQKIEAL